MTDRPAIVAAAESLLNDGGFSTTGMDRIIRAAGVSSRTLYKQLGSRAELIAAVLDARHGRFLATLPSDGVAGLFAALAGWTAVEGARGCLFLRALSEAGGGGDPAIERRVKAHKEAMRRRIADCVRHDLGRADERLAEQILVLFEGATHAAIYRGGEAIEAAALAAATLIRAAGPEAATGDG